MQKPRLRFLRPYRVGVAGLLAIVLAIIGEQLMRSAGGSTPINSTLGTLFALVAALLVGVVAWARNDSPLPEEGIERPTSTQRTFHITRLLSAYQAFRTRLGRRGTALGLAIVAALALWCYLLLRASFTDPLAPWVWLAMLTVLALTFAGVVETAPSEKTLLPHDPAEPPTEPPVSRAEWLVIGAIMLAAALLRLWNVGHFPPGSYIDENERALSARLINRGELIYNQPFTLFGAGWWGIPNLYFWLVGQSMKLFGDDLTGARVVHALEGIATVWLAYRIGRVAWSPRAGLLAGALLAVSDFAIHFSRTVGESTFTLFTWTLCFYFLYKALKTLRPLDFVLSGLAGGLTLYGYVAGKLLPVVMVLVAAYLLARWGLKGFKLYLPRLALLALAALLTYAPSGLYLLSHPGLFDARFQTTSIFNSPGFYTAQYSTDNWGIIVARQFELTYSAFDVLQDNGPFYPTSQPILPVPWAALWLVGSAYVAWRAGDARFGVLGLWLLGGLAGPALTTETPTLQRAVAMVPTLALIPALFLDRVASGIGLLAIGRGKQRPYCMLARALRPVVNVGLALVVALNGTQTLPFYFGSYFGTKYYYEYEPARQYIGKLYPARDVIFQSGMADLLGASSLVFLAKDVPLREFSNPSDSLPFDIEGKNAHVMFWPSSEPAIDVLSLLYPGGTQSSLDKPDGSPIMSAFSVSAEQIASSRQVMARYTSVSGKTVTRPEKGLGTLAAPGAPEYEPPDGVAYPLEAEWAGGLVAPAYGVYYLALNGPAGATLQIDRRTLLVAGGKPETTATVVLAQGIHEVRLAGALDGPKARIELRWGVRANHLVPVESRFLWKGIPTFFFCQVYTGLSASVRDLMLASPAPTGGRPPKLERRDFLLSYRNINQSVNEDPPIYVACEAQVHNMLNVFYVLDVETTGATSIWIDGKLLGSRNVPEDKDTLPAGTQLVGGDHKIELRFGALGDNSQLFLYVKHTNNRRQLLAPSNLVTLKPPEGGAWPIEERPGAPVLDAGVVSDAHPSINQ